MSASSPWNPVRTRLYVFHFHLSIPIIKKEQPSLTFTGNATRTLAEISGAAGICRHKYCWEPFSSSIEGSIRHFEIFISRLLVQSLFWLPIALVTTLYEALLPMPTSKRCCLLWENMSPKASGCLAFLCVHLSSTTGGKKCIILKKCNHHSTSWWLCYSPIFTCW